MLKAASPPPPATSVWMYRIGRSGRHAFGRISYHEPSGTVKLTVILLLRVFSFLPMNIQGFASSNKLTATGDELRSFLCGI